MSARTLTSNTETGEEQTNPGLRSRPRVLSGATYRAETPLGTAFVTVNYDGSEPFEVFLNVGKAGSDLAALAEAIGRLCSLCLRLPSQIPAHERAAAIIGQLGGIGGEHSIGFGPMRVRSLPDAVAHVLAEAMNETADGAAVGTAGAETGSSSVSAPYGAAVRVDQEVGRSRHKGPGGG